MSTATERQRQTANGTTRMAEVSPLDRVVEATEKRQSVTRNAATVLCVAPEKLCDLLRNVWRTSKGEPPLTDQEMFVGISMIARYELDPIAKEVYVTRGKYGVFTIISIDGWIKVLDRTDHYDGFDVDIHRTDDGSIDWVETTIYSTKRSHPAKYRAFAEEYSEIAGVVAKTIPSHMLRIFSLRHAARLFTPIGGSVLTEEEALFMNRDHAPPVERKEVTRDSLLEKFAEPQPVREELPETSYEPNQPPAVETIPVMTSVDTFRAEASKCDTARAVEVLRENWIGENSTRELTTGECDAIRTIAADRIGQLRDSRGKK